METAGPWAAGRRLAENIGATARYPGGPTDITHSWVISPGHRANVRTNVQTGGQATAQILGPYIEMGVGLAPYDGGQGAMVVAVYRGERQ
jgi:hypothetical protein